MDAPSTANVSVWLATAPGPRLPALAGDVEVDVAVVGGGITGLTCALLLKRSGARVAVLEARQVAAGTTGNTTAKLTSLHGLSYAQLVAGHGEEKARMYADANQAAIEQVVDLVAELAIDCQLQRAPAYTYTQRPELEDKVAEEVEVARRLGLPASHVTDTELPYEVRAAVRFDHQAHLHPRRYCLALAEAIAGEGSHVFERTRALDIDEEPNGAAVRTDRGVVHAGWVVVATLLPFVDAGGFFARAHPSRSYAIAVRARPAVSGMYLSAETPTRSVRPLHVGDEPGLVLAGDSHRSGEADDPGGYYADLERWARSSFQVASVDHRWSAQDYSSVDSVPYVGRCPVMARTFVATGFKKWGLSNGTAAAMILADLVAGRDHPWLPVFDARRIGDLAAVKKLVRENLRVGKRFVADHLARRRAPGVEHLRPGQGGVVQVGGETVGAYRDPVGRVHAVGLTCTHLACTVRWNNAERSWDCPCHGSRFDYDGTVLEGPAVKDLAPVALDEQPRP